MRGFEKQLGTILQQVTTQSPRLPCVAAAVVDRDGLVYEGASGELSAEDGRRCTVDTPMYVFSFTKAVVACSALQLVEQGLVDLDLPASTYVPELADAVVVDGFDNHGRPIERPPTRPITTRHLLTHTAGFAFPQFNDTAAALAAEHGLQDSFSGQRAALDTRLVFDPGTDWEYGLGLDWAGQVVEAVTGKSLGEVLDAAIFAPLGMESSSMTSTAAFERDRAPMHTRTPDGGVAPVAFDLPADPEVQMGGHALRSTMRDYAAFLQMLLNDGQAPDGTTVLQPATVDLATQDHLPPDVSFPVPDFDPDADITPFLPGEPIGWSFLGMVNRRPAFTGRAAGSHWWAGGPGLFWWLDPITGIGGVWGTQLLPLGDRTTVQGFLALETAVYSAMTSN